MYGCIVLQHHVTSKGIHVFRKSMSICQVKLIMYASPSLYISIHSYRFVSNSNVRGIDLKLKNLLESLILCTCPTFATSSCPALYCVCRTSHTLISIMAMMDYWQPANMTGCHRSLSRDFQTLFPPELTIIGIVY